MHKKLHTIRHSLQWIICILFTVALSHVSMAQQKFEQLQEKITLQGDHETMLTLIQQLEKQSKLVFSYSAEQLKDIRLPAISFRNRPLGEVLNFLEKHAPVEIIELQGSIGIKRSGKPVPGQRMQASSSIRGRIVEFETSVPLLGATVQLQGASRGTVSDNSGYYNFADVPEGKYILFVSMIGFQQERVQVEVRAGREAVIDVKLKGAVLNEVVVNGRRARTKAPVAYSSIADLITEIKTARVVVSGISSEQITKSGDRNAAEVLKRVSGLTVKDEKFVIVRGMDSRYNLTYLNDNIAPSTELYTRDFSLDLIPSRIIDRILVYKSASADMLGDMAGGAVKIYTKDAKMVRHFDIEVQGGYRPNTTFKDMLTYQGGKYDFLGIDDGTRKLPSVVPGYGNFTRTNVSQATYAKALSPVLQYAKQSALPNIQVTANYFDYLRIGKRPVSTLTSLSYKHDYQSNNIYRAQGLGNPDVGAPDDRVFFDQQGIENAQLSLLQNFTLRLRDSSTIQFKNFLLNQGQKATIVSLSQPADWTPESIENGFVKPSYKNITLSYSQRFLYAGNLGGRHYINRSKKGQLYWNLGYSYSHQLIPDQRLIRLQQETDRLGYYPSLDINRHLEWRARTRAFAENGTSDDVFGIISRVWIKNKESVYNGTLDYSQEIKPWLTLHAGTFQQWKERNVFRRVYLVQEGDVRGSAGADHEIGPGGYGDYMDPEILFFREQDLGKVWSTEYLRENTSGLKVFDRTNGGDTYQATEQLNTGYLAASLTPLNKKLEIYTGVRVEYSRQKLAGAIFRQPQHITEPVFVDNRKTNVLPSVNLSWRPLSKLVFRGGYGRTVNRPEFREIAPYNDIDYINSQRIVGNPTIVMAEIDNLDARVEFYPRSEGEVISVGGFYKHLDRPIERTREDVRIGGNLPTISFQNAGKATVKGLELEFRKTLDIFPGKFFRDLSIMGNLTLIKSEVIKDSTDLAKDSAAFAGLNYTFRRQLQGQAPYIVNAGLYYDNAGSGTKVSIIYNVTGTRIYAAGRAFTPSSFGRSYFRGSLFELPRHLLDFTLSQRIFKSLQAKLTVQNLLDQPIQMAEDYDSDFEYTKGHWETVMENGVEVKKFIGDTRAFETNPGRYYILNFTWSF